MRTIKLSDGVNQAIVDDDDYDYLSQFTWSNCRGYPTTTYNEPNKYGLPHKKPVSMHRIITKQITNTENRKHVDHINRNKLDNRKCNLRIVSISDNIKNKDKKRTFSKNPHIQMAKRSTKKYGIITYYKCFGVENDKYVYKKLFRDKKLAIEYISNLV